VHYLPINISITASKATAPELVFVKKLNMYANGMPHNPYISTIKKNTPERNTVVK
jgi:hypothetical protein